MPSSRAYRTKAYMKFYLRPDLIRRKFSKSEGREELLEMMGGATVLRDRQGPGAQAHPARGPRQVEHRLRTGARRAPRRGALPR